MEILAKANDDGTYDLSLHNAPPKAIAEVRWQNTFTGVTFVDMVETDATGSATLSHVQSFGQHCVPTVRVLNDGNALEVVSFTYHPPDDTNDLLLTSNTASLVPPMTVTPMTAPVIHPELEEDSHV